MEIGDKIRRLRLQRGLTQEELAGRCELSKSFISLLERDLTSPSLDTNRKVLELVPAHGAHHCLYIITRLVGRASPGAIPTTACYRRPIHRMGIFLLRGRIVDRLTLTVSGAAIVVHMDVRSVR